MNLNKEQPRHEHRTLNFPPGFLWGSSTSAHQVEGNNKNNDWWAWEQATGHITDGSTSGATSGHYERYKEDFKLAKDNHQNAHRLSIEWSRIEPKEGEWDRKEIEHYREVLMDLKEKGFTVMLTLHHFTLPKWISDKGGWERRSTVRAFVHFVEYVAKELGQYVDLWVTINEPNVYTSQSYIEGLWPPGKKNIFKSLLVFLNLTRAHRASYLVLHRLLDNKTKQVEVGIAKNAISFEPYRRHTFIDMFFVRLVDWFWNHLFFNRTKRYHDFIGINYYFHYRVKFVPKISKQLFFEVHNENREVSDVGWETFPPGIFQVIQDLASYKKPIYITENGIAAVNDDKRIRFIVGHLKEVYHAIESGVDVRGYFHWSLLDNFEWEKGFEPRFGLVEVDYETMARIPRPSLKVYGEIAKNNAINHDTLRFLGHGAEVR